MTNPKSQTPQTPSKGRESRGNPKECLSQVRNGLSLKYRVVCSRVWPHLDQLSNLHNLQCYTQLRPQVRNGLSLKYRVVCSRVWPHLGEFTNYTTLVIISLCLWVWVDIQVCKPLMLVYVARHWILGSSHSALLGRATFLLTEDLVQPTVSWLKNFSIRGKASGLAGYGWISKYEALNSSHNLQCHIQLRLQVRNGLGLKYRVLCSRVWPHLGKFTKYITLVIILLCHD